MSVQSFETTKVPLGSLRKKCHLDVTLVESHREY
jgi:hypothetical protein